MRFIRLFVVAFVGISLLASSQLVSAREASSFRGYTPYGFADTFQSSHPLQSNQFYMGYLKNGNDKDWFKWTNNTDQFVILHVYLFSPFWKNYDMIGGYLDTFGHLQYTETVPDRGPYGKADHFEIFVPQRGLLGSTINWKVFPHTHNDYSTTANYVTWVVPEPIDWW